MMLLAALPGAAPSLHGQDDSSSACPSRGPQPDRDRGAHRLLRQHARAAQRPLAAIPRSSSCSRACGRRPWRPTPTRTCPSRSWSRSSAPERDLAAHPLFQVHVRAPERPAAAARASPASSWSRFTSTAGAARFDLDTRLFADRPTGWAGPSSTAPTSSTRQRIERMAGHFEALLAARVADPDRRPLAAAAPHRRQSGTCCSVAE